MKVRSARFLISAGMAMVIAGAALAEAPARSKRPQPRPEMASDATLAGLPKALSAPVQPADAPPGPIFPTKPLPRPVSIDGATLSGEGAVPADAAGADLLARPRPRPVSILEQASALAGPSAPDSVAKAVVVSTPAAAISEPPRTGFLGLFRPNPRPRDLQAKQAAAVRIVPGKQATVSKKGSVCGIADIKGEKLASIPSRIKGCGVDDPVRVNSIAGIRLSTPATINCETAKALRSWITKAVEPTYGKGKVAELQIAASYSCRPRNNKKGAKVSEHGRGNAIDIGGLVFSSGKAVSVLKDYDKPMRKVHKAACGIFGTTLGPGSDGYHENHLHFDMARYRGGTYCR